jgi:hypothetical protein
MSQKITSKNLSYSSNLPPFLAKLQAQASGNPGPDPVIAGQRRSAKKRSGSEEAEDAPLVVDEEGNAVSVELDRDGGIVKRQGRDSEDYGDGDKAREALEEGVAGGGEKSEGGGGETLAAPAGRRKRKVGKVVGSEAEAEDEKKGEVEEKNARQTAAKPKKDGEEDGSTSKKMKKKAKKIKLSFDDEDG